MAEKIEIIDLLSPTTEISQPDFIIDLCQNDSDIIEVDPEIEESEDIIEVEDLNKMDMDLNMDEILPKNNFE
jgi:hypothetical protein